MAARKKTARKKTTARKKKTAAVKKPAARKKTAKKKTQTKKKAAARPSTGSKKKKKKAAAKSGSKSSAASRTSKKSMKKTATKKKATTTSKKTTTKKRARTAEEVRPGFTPYKEKRGEQYMNPQQVEHFRDILLGWRQELMEEVDRTVHHMQDEAANFPDPNDRATLEEEFALELRTRDRERKLIKKINESLAALENGDYGYCEVCGIEIGIRRLEARPTATLCIDCKTLDEIKERQFG